MERLAEIEQRYDENVLIVPSWVDANDQLRQRAEWAEREFGRLERALRREESLRAQHDSLTRAYDACERLLRDQTERNERLRSLVKDIRRLHESPLHQSFAGSCDGCDAIAEFDIDT